MTKLSFCWLGLLLTSAAAIFGQNIRGEDLAKLPFPNGYPTEDARKRLLDEHYFERAVQVYLGALPAVNMLAMRDGSEAKFGAGYQILTTWKKRMNAKTLVTTPNADVVYAMSYLDLKKDGPLVVAAPPGLIGMFTDFWQRALTDVGVGGPDKGQGGLYLLLPPDFDGPIPGGYFAFRSSTYNVFLFWRATLTKGPDGPDPTRAVETIEKTLVYPLRTGPGDWRKMEFPDASGVPVNMLYPRDASYFEKLAHFIDYEPAESGNEYLRGMMASLGIVKGKPFTPDEHQRQILQRAAELAPKIAEAINISPEELPERRYYRADAKRQWINAFPAVDDKFRTNSYLNLDLQSTYFAIAYSCSPLMTNNMPGLGSRYPSTFWDADGELLAGERSYSLHLPPNPPAALFWSATIYSPIDGTMIDNGQRYPSINGFDTIKQNEDGSVDLYFGPQLPAGKPASNWLKTNPGQGYFVSLRFYGATMPFYDQSWIPGDIVKIK